MESVASLDAAEDRDKGPRQIYVRAANKGRAWLLTCADIKDFFAACGKPRAVYNKWGEELGDADNVREVCWLELWLTACARPNRPWGWVFDYFAFLLFQLRRRVPFPRV
eukprot:484210-Pleurochrysis_carterae.AAC.1